MELEGKCKIPFGLTSPFLQSLPGASGYGYVAYSGFALHTPGACGDIDVDSGQVDSSFAMLATTHVAACDKEHQWPVCFSATGAYGLFDMQGCHKTSAPPSGVDLRVFPGCRLGI